MGSIEGTECDEQSFGIKPLSAIPSGTSLHGTHPGVTLKCNIFAFEAKYGFPRFLKELIASASSITDRRTMSEINFRGLVPDKMLPSIEAIQQRMKESLPEHARRK